MTEQINNTKTHKILLVDDDPSLLKLFAVRFRSLGFEVNTAESAEQAVTQLPSNLPHVVITDLRMGEMDGMALFRYIKDVYPTIPVIILTAHGTVKDAITAKNEGVFGFLTKPCESKELIELVRKALIPSA